MKALVTGANGFIGSHLATALTREGWDVVAGIRRDTPGPWASTHVFDLARAAVPPEALAGVDVVFHLAAASEADAAPDKERSMYARLNIDGTRRILEACRHAGVRRFVFFSSVKAVGEGGETRIDDDVVPSPITEYGRSKLEGERMALDGCYVPEPVVLRLSPVYGPGGRGNLGRMIAALLKGRFPPVPETGNRRSMVYVADVVKAAEIAATSDDVVGRSFFVTDGVDYSTRDLYEILASGLGVPVRRGWPLWVFRAMATAGDVGSRVSGRRAPLDSEVMRKLFGSAYYDIDPFRRVGYEPAWTLEKVWPEVVRGVASGIPDESP